MKSLVMVAAFARALLAPDNAQIDALTAGDLNELCSGADAESKSGCRL